MTVFQRVLAVVEHQAGTPADPDSRLVEDLDLDSLDRIELAVQLERAFDIDIPDEDVDRPELGTVEGLARYIERRLADA